jgi:ribose-phosphate pyrophosphokinase
MITLKNYTQNCVIPITQLTFPAGERHVSIDYSYLRSRDHIYMYLDFQSSDDIVDMMHLREILANHKVTLSLNYVPFARQDRAVNLGEVNAMKVFGKLVNSLNFEKVLVADPHSDVVEAVIDRIVITPQHLLANQIIDRKYDYIISPDIGATKKTEKYAALVDTPVLQCNKKRDLKTGKILKFEILDCPDLAGKRVLVLDDIGDGLGTFHMLADAINNDTCEKYLYITHGIFSKGLDEIMKKYRGIFCHNPMNFSEKFINGYYGGIN